MKALIVIFAGFVLPTAIATTAFGDTLPLHGTGAVLTETR